MRDCEMSQQQYCNLSPCFDRHLNSWAILWHVNHNVREPKKVRQRRPPRWWKWVSRWIIKVSRWRDGSESIYWLARTPRSDVNPKIFLWALNFRRAQIQWHHTTLPQHKTRSRRLWCCVELMVEWVGGSRTRRIISTFLNMFQCPQPRTHSQNC